MARITISEAVPSGMVDGFVEDGFRPVLDAFLENFRTRGEVGAGVALTHEGRTVVDVWGGSANPKTATPWTRDTLVGVFSCTKGALAILAHRLADQGRLDLDAPVAALWPDYASHGKGETTLRMMLDHTAGVPALREQVPDGAFLDWDYMAMRLAAEAPFFPPGTRSAYHGLTYAWTVGEVIRRATGTMAGVLFAEEIARPLGLEFWIGLPEAEEPRVARLLKARLDPAIPASRFVRDLADRESIPALFFLNDGGFNPNRADYRAAEIGSANGVTNARSLARLYAPFSLDGSLDGVRLVSARRIPAMTRISNASHDDATLRCPMRFAAGFMRSVDNRWLRDPPAASLILSDAAFGHAGAGGSIGFADPEARLSMGYVMNQMGLGQLLNERGQALVDATYSALGYHGKGTGAWVR